MVSWSGVALLLVATTQFTDAALTCVSVNTLVSDDYCNLNCNHEATPFCPYDFCRCSEDGTTTSNPSTGQSSSDLTCIGHGLATDAWCNSNCNHRPSFCPAALCTCTGGTTTTTTGTSATPTPTPSGLSCSSIREPATDTWCDVNCNQGYCPPDFCTCTGSLGGTPLGSWHANAGCIVYTDTWCEQVCSTGTSCPLNCCNQNNTDTWYHADLTECPNYTDQWCSMTCNMNADVCPTCCIYGARPTHFNLCPAGTDAWCSDVCTTSGETCPFCCSPVDGLDPIPADLYVATSSCPAEITDAVCTATCNVGTCNACCALATQPDTAGVSSNSFSMIVIDQNLINQGAMTATFESNLKTALVDYLVVFGVVTSDTTLTIDFTNVATAGFPIFLTFDASISGLSSSAAASANSALQEVDVLGNFLLVQVPNIVLTAVTAA